MRIAEDRLANMDLAELTEIHNHGFQNVITFYDAINNLFDLIDNTSNHDQDLLYPIYERRTLVHLLYPTCERQPPHFDKLGIYQ